jgi:hypothetical protein
MPMIKPMELLRPMKHSVQGQQKKLLRYEVVVGVAVLAVGQQSVVTIASKGGPRPPEGF